MRFNGKLFKDGSFWLVEIPILDVMTQGRTKKEALEMTKDLIRTMADDESLAVDIYCGKGDVFEISSVNTQALISLLLQRKRELSGLSLAEVAEKMGSSSRNSYARYEQGRTMPTVEKLNELLRIVSSGRDFVLQESVLV